MGNELDEEGAYPFFNIYCYWGIFFWRTQVGKEGIPF